MNVKGAALGAAALILAATSVATAGGVWVDPVVGVPTLFGTCTEVHARIDYSNFANGVILHAILTLNGTTYTRDDIVTDTGVDEWDLPFKGKGTFTVEAWAQNPDGTDAQPEHQTVTRSFDLTCVAPARYAPSARFLGPCGDPMHAAVFNNTASNRAIRFLFVYRDGGSIISLVRRVAAHAVVITHWRHVDGHTQMRIQARGKTIRVATSAAAGNYHPCQPQG